MSSHITATRKQPSRSSRKNSPYTTRRDEFPLPRRSTTARKVGPIATTTPTTAKKVVVIPELPYDVISTIISLRIADPRGGREELVKDLGALALVFKAFVETCQREIFRVVILQPPEWDYEENLSRLDRHPDNVPRFVEVVTNNPVLGTYVRRLVYRSLRRIVDIRAALDAMDGVEDFTLELGGKEASSLLLWDEGLAKSIRRLMTNATLKSLTIRNYRLPSTDFELPSGLESLSLDNAWYEGPDPWDEPTYYDPKKETLKPAVKNLAVRGKRITLTLPMTWMTEKRLGYPSQRMPLDLRRIESLEILVDSHVTPRVLEETESLKALHFCTVSYVDSQTPVTASPLTGINPACFDTLTTLSLDIRLDTVCGGQTIFDPYFGLFLDTYLIRKFTHLEELTINIHLNAGFKWGEMPPEAFGPQWSTIDTTLAPPTGCPFPHLNRVTVFVVLEAWEYKYRTQDFITNFNPKVLNRQFEGLRRLEAEGVIDLLLGIEFWDTHEDL